MYATGMIILTVCPIGAKVYHMGSPGLARDLRTKAKLWHQHTWGLMCSGAPVFPYTWVFSTCFLGRESSNFGVWAAPAAPQNHSKRRGAEPPTLCTGF